MRPVTACVITRNEEENLGACLEALGFCHEVVVVDCGSTDRTVEVARESGARVVVRDWPGMVAQKNRAVDEARTDWVLCVDADERVTPPLAAAIARALDEARAETAVGYEMAWETVYLGGPVRSDRGRSRWKLRLFDRRRGRWTGDDPHGHVVVEGPVARLEGALRHHTYRDLAHHVEKMNDYTAAAAAVLLSRRRSAFAGMLLRAPWAFVRSFVLRGGFRDGARGFVVAVMAAAYVFLKHARLAELRRTRRTS